MSAARTASAPAEAGPSPASVSGAGADGAEPRRHLAQALRPSARRGRVVPHLDAHLQLTGRVRPGRVLPSVRASSRRASPGAPPPGRRRPPRPGPPGRRPSGSPAAPDPPCRPRLSPRPSRAGDARRPGRRAGRTRPGAPCPPFPGRPPHGPRGPAAELPGQRPLHRLGHPRVERHPLGGRRLLGLPLDLLDEPQGDPADVAGVHPRAARRRGRRRGVGDVLRADGDPDVAPVEAHLDRPVAELGGDLRGEVGEAFISASRAAGSMAAPSRAAVRCVCSSPAAAAAVRSSRSWATYRPMSMTPLWRHRRRQSTATVVSLRLADEPCPYSQSISCEGPEARRHRRVRVRSLRRRPEVAPPSSSGRRGSRSRAVRRSGQRAGGTARCGYGQAGREYGRVLHVGYPGRPVGRGVAGVAEDATGPRLHTAAARGANRAHSSGASSADDVPVDRCRPVGRADVRPPRRSTTPSPRVLSVTTPRSPAGRRSRCCGRRALRAPSSNGAAGLQAQVRGRSPG